MIYTYLSVLMANRWLFHFNANSYQSNEEVAWFNSFISNYYPTYTVDINTCSTHYKHDDYRFCSLNLVVIKGVWKGNSYSLIETNFKFNAIKCLELHVLSKSNINKNYFSGEWITLCIFSMKISSSAFVLLLTFTTIVSGGGHETPQQVVTRFNNYKTICTGLGYQNVRCDAPKKGITVTH